ncbi:MAG: hypothetical protein ABH811_00205 [archaeon]
MRDLSDRFGVFIQDIQGSEVGQQIFSVFDWINKKPLGEYLPFTLTGLFVGSIITGYFMTRYKTPQILQSDLSRNPLNLFDNYENIFTENDDFFENIIPKGFKKKNNYNEKLH